MLTEKLYDEHDDKPEDDRCKLEQTWEMFLPLSAENLQHDDVEKSPRRETLQGVDQDIRDLATTSLGDEDPCCDTQAAGEAEYSKVGVEYESLGAGLQQLHADTEGDDELVAGDS